MELTAITDLGTFLTHPNIKVEVVHLRPQDIKRDLERRLQTEGNSWEYALVVGKDSDEPNRRTGMILVKRHLSRPGKFIGLYYSHAHCGDDSEGSQATIESLGLLNKQVTGWSLENSVRGYKKLCMRNIGGGRQQGLVGPIGTTIEPL